MLFAIDVSLQCFDIFFECLHALWGNPAESARHLPFEGLDHFDILCLAELVYFENVLVQFAQKRLVHLIK